MLRLPAKASNVTINYAQLPANPQLPLAIRVRIAIITDGIVRYRLN